MNKNIKVIGGYKCGCTFGPIKRKDRLEYCGVHGMDIANEYEIPSGAHLTKDAQDGASRPRCTVCGTTKHHVDEKGNIIPNPPRL